MLCLENVWKIKSYTSFIKICYILSNYIQYLYSFILFWYKSYSIFYFFKLTIYYIKYSDSSCLLDTEYEPTVLTAEEKDITNVVEEIYHYAILLLIILYPNYLSI